MRLIACLIGACLVMGLVGCGLPATPVSPATRPVASAAAVVQPMAAAEPQPNAIEPQPAHVGEPVAVNHEDDPLRPPGPDYHWVKPYTKLDGTPVAGHWSRNPTPSVRRPEMAASQPKPKPLKRENIATSSAEFTNPRASSTDAGGRVWVNGYTRKDGVSVKGHWRKN